MNKMLKKLVCMVLCTAMVVTSLSVMAFAADEAEPYEITFDGCTQIGWDSDEEYPVYYTQVPYGTSSVVFSELSLTEDSMIASVGANEYVEGTDTAPLKGFEFDLEDIDTYFILDEEYEDIVQEGAYAFWIMDDDLEMYYFIINVEAYEGTDPNFFEVSAGEVVDVEEDGYTMENWVQDETGNWVPETISLDLYTVELPFGSQDVALTFAEDRIAYGYTAAGEYLYSCSSNTETGYAGNGQVGELKANVYDPEAIVIVQTPYDSNWTTTMLYAVQFEFTYTFEAAAGGVDLSDIEYVDDIYTLTDMWTGKPVGTTGAYVVKIPEGTENVSLKFSDNVLAYNYSQAGEFIDGLYDDFMTGSAERSVKIDANEDGEIDFIQVQVPYDQFWNTSVLYAITFDYDGEAEVVKPSDEEYEAIEGKYIGNASEEMLEKLMNGLGAKCEGASDWNVVSAAAMELDVKLDKDKVIADAIAAYQKPSGTNLAAAIIKLAAIGEDATALSDGEDGTLDLLGKLASSASCISGWAECEAYALLAYQAYPSYGVSTEAVNSVEAVITSLLKYQNEDGGFGGWGSSADTTGAAIAALIPYVNVDANVLSALDDAIEFLLDTQNEDGGWGYAAGADTNVDSTALAIIGLCAGGIDPTVEDFNKNGKNPVTAILSFAAEDGSGLVLPAGTSVAYAESDALRALCAYSGLRNSGMSYNVYAQAVNGGAFYIKPEVEEGLANEAAADGNWYYYVGDEIATDVTTVAHNNYGWWLVENGKVNFEANTIANNANGWWVIENGKVNFEAEGVYKNGNGWWYCTGGKVDFEYNGFGSNANGDWYCENGKVNFDVNDIINGTVKGVNAWWYVVDSKVTYGVETVEHNAYGWWYVGKDGKVDFTKTTVAHNGNGWWYCKDGKVDFTYNGLGTNANGTWYIKDGKVDFTFNGTYAGKTIVNGKVQ